MTKIEVLESKQLKKRFCKDLNIPVSVFDNPYFLRHLEAADAMKDGVLAKFDSFVESLENFADEQEYFEYYNSVKDAVINDIKAQQGYYALQDAIFSWESGIARIGELAFPAEPWEMSRRQNLYSEANCGEPFVSIDMRHANFTAMQAFDPSIFSPARTWEEYLSGFTDSPHIIGSKYIRQVIFGACNPKRQVQLEQWLMLNVLSELVHSKLGIRLFSLTGDEIILYGDWLEADEVTYAIKDAWVSDALKVEKFTIEKIRGTGGYVRRTEGGDVAFKGLEAELWHQAALYYAGMPITDDDLVFVHNGRLARFLEPIPDPWKESGGEN